jgi:S1-C subfamily serine protease
MKLLRNDPSTDIAIFRFENADIPVAPIGDAKTLKVGHLVLSLARSSDGNIRATMGGVSALGGA